jgi:hypothetical protein
MVAMIAVLPRVSLNMIEAVAQTLMVMAGRMLMQCGQ